MLLPIRVHFVYASFSVKCGSGEAPSKDISCTLNLNPFPRNPGYALGIVDMRGCCMHDVEHLIMHV